MDLKKIADEIYSDTEDRERMNQMNDIYFQMADLIKEKLPGEYEKFKEQAESILYEITEDEAVDIVKSMEPYGERWTMDDVCSTLESADIKPSVEYYLVMNMMFNDYNDVFKDFDVDTIDFYVAMSKAFVDDEDGVAHKVSKYFEME